MSQEGLREQKHVDTRPVAQKVSVPPFTAAENARSSPGAMGREQACFFRLETPEASLDRVKVDAAMEESMDVYEETRQRLYCAPSRAAFDALVARVVRVCTARGDAQLARAMSEAVRSMSARRAALPEAHEDDDEPARDVAIPRPGNECGAWKHETRATEQYVEEVTPDCWKWSVWRTCTLKQRSAGWTQLGLYIFSAPDTSPVACYRDNTLVVAVHAPGGRSIHVHCIDGDGGMTHIQFARGGSGATKLASLTLAAGTFGATGTFGGVAVCAHEGVYLLRSAQDAVVGFHTITHPVCDARPITSVAFAAAAADDERPRLLLGSGLGCIWTVPAVPREGEEPLAFVALHHVLPVRQLEYHERVTSAATANQVLLAPDASAFDEGEQPFMRGLSIPRPVHFVARDRLVISFSKYGYIVFNDVQDEQRPAVVPAPEERACRFVTPWYRALSLSPNATLLSVLYSDGHVVVLKI